MNHIYDIFLNSSGLQAEIIQPVKSKFPSEVYQILSQNEHYVIQLTPRNILESIPNGRANFYKEAASVSRIYHPCVSKLLSVGENKSYFYKIRQETKGKSLRLKIQERTLSNLELIKLAKTLTELLIEIKQYGLTFFELSIENIFLNSQQDFQIQDGVSIDISHQTDSNLCTIGAILFECVTQNKLHYSSENNDQHGLNKQLENLDSKNPIHLIIKKLLSHQTQSNFQNAQELLNTLQRISEPNGLALTYYTTPFIGRTYQVTQIDLPFQKLMKGQGSTVFLQGPSGSGKTRFEIEISKDFNRRGAFIVYARANDFKTPFSALISALDGYIQQVSELPTTQKAQHEEAIRQATGKFSSILQKFCPLLSAIIPLSKSIKIEKISSYVTQAWIEFFCKLSKVLGQIVIIFDDPKLLDPESVVILKKLIQQTSNYPILIMVSGESHSENSQVIHEFMEMTTAGKYTIDFNFFTESELEIFFHEYLQQKSLPNEILSFLVKHGHGNLLILTQFLNEFFLSGLMIPSWNKYIINSENLQNFKFPESLEELRLSKFNSLSEKSQVLLKSAAFIGETFTIVALSKIHNTPEAQVIMELSEAAKSHFIIFNTPYSCQWVHPSIRTYILSLMTEIEIQAGHQNFIKLTLSHVEPSKPGNYLESAFHLEKMSSIASTPENWTIFYRAAQEAAEIFSFDTAYRFLESCSKLTNENIGFSNQAFLKDYFVFFAEVCFQLGNISEANQNLNSALLLSHSKADKGSIFLGLANLNLASCHPNLAKKDLGKAFHELEIDRNNIFAAQAIQYFPYYHKYQNQSFFEVQQNHWLGVTKEFQKYSQEISAQLSENSPIPKAIEKKLECIVSFSLGLIKDSQKLAQELLTQDIYWLDQSDEIELTFFLITTYFLQGKILEVNQVIDNPNLKSLNSISHYNTKTNFVPFWLKIWRVASLATLGETEKSRSLLVDIEENFSENFKQSDFFQSFYVTSQLIYFYFTNQLGEVYEKTECTFNNFNLSPSDSALISHLGFIVIAYSRLQLYVQSEIPLKEEKLKKLRLAIENLEKVPKNGLLIPHLKCLQSSLFLAENDMNSAWAILSEGEKSAFESENLWALFQITLQKSRFLKQKGYPDGALACLEYAFKLTKNNQWSSLVEGIKKEFKIDQSPRPMELTRVEKGNGHPKKMDFPQSSTTDHKPPTSSPRSESTQGYVDALLKLNREKSRLAKDLEVTGIVQSLLLPKESIASTECYNMASFYQSAAQSGGDWWWYEKDPEDGLSIILADVTGHGAGSAMVTATVASSYRTLTGLRGTDQKVDFSWLFPRINANLYSICAGTYGMTLSAFQFSKQGNLNCWCAGAPPLMILKNSTGEVITRFMPSTSLGSPEITVTQENLHLEKGDRIFVFTDGAYEFPTSTRPNFGLKGLRKLLASTHGKTIEYARHLIAKEIESLRTTSTLSDDLTFILIDYI